MRPVVILHGLFGSSRNWQSISKRLSNELMNRPVFTLNLRNHGCYNNPKAIIGPIKSWETFNNDLEFFWEESLDQKEFDLIGHSFGGQVAMSSLLSSNSILRDSIKKLIVVDISLRHPSEDSFNVSNDKLYRLMQSMIDINEMKTSSRSDVIAKLKDTENDENVINFLLLNLVKKGDGFSFENICVEHLIKSWSMLRETWKEDFVPWNGDVLFLKGERSDYVKSSDENEIAKYFPKFKIETIRNSNHWPHFDNPTEFINKVACFLK